MLVGAVWLVVFLWDVWCMRCVAYRMLVSVCCVMSVGWCLLVVRCGSLLVVRSLSLCDVCFAMCVVCRSLRVAHCSLFVACCMLCVVRCLVCVVWLSGVWCVMWVVCCLRSAVSCVVAFCLL